MSSVISCSITLRAFTYTAHVAQVKNGDGVIKYKCMYQMHYNCVASIRIKAYSAYKHQTLRNEL